MIEPDGTSVYLKLLVLKTRQVERLLAFYQTLGIDFTQEQHGKGPAHHSGQIGGAWRHRCAGRFEGAPTVSLTH